jgi:hypothetical protein
MSEREAGATFYAPGVRNPSRYTECFACSRSKAEHGPEGECPLEEDEP